MKKFLKKLVALLAFWVAYDKQKPAEPTTPDKPNTPQGDEVPYNELNWQYGGYNGSKNAIDPNTQIADLRFSKNGLSFRFAKGSCVTLGAKSSSDTDSIMVNVFYKDASGNYRGGKFDWIADNRNQSRDLNHVFGSKPYENWTSSWIPNPADAVFVLTSTSGKRSNTIKGTHQR